MSKTVSIMIVEDDSAMRQSCAKLFRLKGYNVAEASSAADALEAIGRGGNINIVLSDIKMPEMDGMALLREIKSLDRNIEVVLMTGYGSIKNAIEAMKYGAADYITKPFNANELLMTISKITQLSPDKSGRKEVPGLPLESREEYHFGNIVGSSSKMHLVYKKIKAATKTDSTVLICGDSGTGKELVAKAIHYNGLRADKPFVPVNCAAMPPDLIESELFGHKKGAFTGAFSDSAGLFLAADGGTIFLDEIVEVPYSGQAKLLRALQEKRIRLVGDTREIGVDIRVIASTNQDVDKAIREGRFREDLYYRLSIIRITLPPLRARADDIPLLVQHFIAEFNKTFQRTVKGIGKDALDVLTRYEWPGNVRELASAIENTFALANSDTIGTLDLPTYIREHSSAESHRPPLDDKEAVSSISDVERMALVRALRVSEGNKTHAAKLLGVSRPRLYKMIRRHGVDK